jgi:hypothetical protein
VRYGIIAPSSGDTVSTTFSGQGGLSSISLGLSYAPISSLSTGIQVNYNYGHTEQYQTVAFTNSDYSSDDINRSFYYNACATVTVGAQYHGFGEIFDTPSLTPLTVGFIFTTKSNFSVSEHRTYTNVDTTNIIYGSSSFPYTLGAGVSYTFGNRLLISSDFLYQPWSTWNYMGAHPSDTTYGTDAIVTLRDVKQFGLGLELSPSRNASGFFEKTIYRLGFTYQSTYYLVGGQGINEYTGSVGFGFPIGSDARLNVNLHAGVRGSIQNGLQKDTMVKLSVGISASELWFLTFGDDEQ